MTYTSTKGLVGLVRHWAMKNYAQISYPLYEYTQGELPKKTKEGVTLNKADKECFSQTQESSDGCSHPGLSRR